MTLMRLANIKTEEPFKNLFRIYNEDYQEVLKDMKANGYDENEPILIWEDKDILIDGHTRLMAAGESGLKRIPISNLKFDSEEEALRYSIKRNKNKGRRVTAGDKFRLFEVLDRVGERSSGKNQYSRADSKDLLSANDSPSRKHTAKLIGASDVQVTKMRTIKEFADEEDIEKVKNDELSVDAAWRSAKATKQRIDDELNKESKFNRTNDNIEWALWTWNPVTGCKHGCKYCYARDIANRFYPEKFEPTFRPARLSAPQDTPIPNVDEGGEHNVFVCSMADLFGDWVPDEWIDNVLDVIRNSPKWWNYLFLTKNPKRYLKIDWPNNCWVGTTVDIQARVEQAEKAFSNFAAPVKFFSCEPFQEELSFNSLEMIDWLIIGGRSKSTGMPAGQPEWRWVEKLIHKAREANVKVYFKPNLTARPREYPEIKKKEE